MSKDWIKHRASQSTGKGPYQVQFAKLGRNFRGRQLRSQVRNTRGYECWRYSRR
jgi:hypothetical protein